MEAMMNNSKYINMGILINYSEASRMLTGDRTAIRSNYKGNKWKEAVNELKTFEREWIKKYKRVL
jgi:hypothetical protein